MAGSKKVKGDLVLVVTTNDQFVAGLRKELRSKGYKYTKAASLAGALEKIRQQNFFGAIVDTFIEWVPGLEVADAMRAVAPDLHCVALRERVVGRPPVVTPRGSRIISEDRDSAAIVALLKKRGRGRRRPSKPEPEETFESIIETPLQLERKAFLEAADKFYLNSAIDACSVKPRLAAAVAGDSVASVYRLLEEYGITYGRAAGAKMGRRKKS